MAKAWHALEAEGLSALGIGWCGTSLCSRALRFSLGDFIVTERPFPFGFNALGFNSLQPAPMSEEY